MGVPKLKPPLAGGAAAVGVPNENPDPAAGLAAAGAPKLNFMPPPLPKLTPAAAGLAASFSLATSSSQPGLVDSQARHWILALSFLVRHPWHSQLEAFCDLAKSAKELPLLAAALGSSFLTGFVAGAFLSSYIKGIHIL